MTWALLMALKPLISLESKVKYIHIDAHHDLYGSANCNSIDYVAHSNFLQFLLTDQVVDQVVLIGGRDNQMPVKDAIMRGFSITSKPTYEPDFRETKNDSMVHTHLSVDLDILDPKIAPHVSAPIPVGWSLSYLLKTLKLVIKYENVDSFSLVEIGPHTRPDPTITKILSLVSQEVVHCI